MTTAMTMMATTAETLAMTTLSGCIRCFVRLAVTPSRSSTHQSTSVSKLDLEHVVEDDYSS
jgi:hypothetical protein